uniref:Uncharacterized protein n=1 Tax=Timema tahoe TaxID=61484 RepID=A0A7R9NV96_9NEOP|nr:unnamed protein product [Timema tahoe]
MLSIKNSYQVTATCGVNILQLKFMFSMKEDALTHLGSSRETTTLQRRAAVCSKPVSYNTEDSFDCVNRSWFSLKRDGPQHALSVRLGL